MPVDQLLRDHQPLHSDLQIEAWILTEGNWTDWGRYQQALRELHGRRAAIESLSRETDLALLDLRALERRRPLFGRDRRERWRIRVEAQQCKVRDLFATVIDTQREFERFHQLAAELKASLGEITPARRRELDRETWMTRIRYMAAIDFQFHGRMSPALVRMVAALPPELRHAALETARDPAKLMKTVETA